MPLRASLYASVAVLGLLAAPAYATQWIVSSATGSDSNDGKTVGTAFLTLQHAADATAPGDTVSCIGVFGGGTGAGNVLNITKPGTSGNPITYQSYYQGLAGPPCLLLSTQASYTIHIDPSSTANIAYITINGLELAGSNGSITLAGAWTNASLLTTYGNSGLYNGSGVLIDNGTAPANQTATGTNAAAQAVINTSTNPVSAGVLPGDGVYDTTHPTSTPTGTVVVSTTTSSITVTPNLAGIVSNADTLKIVHIPHHISVLNNKVHDYSESGIQCSYGDYMTVSGNIVSNNGWYSPFAGSGISCGFSRDVDTTTGYKSNIIGNITAGNQNLIANHFNSEAGTVNATSAAGVAVLHFASAVVGVTNGQQVFDTTSGNNAAILAGTTVLSGAGTTTLTLSQNIQTGSGSGVGATDTFLFASITDGEGIIVDDNLGDQLGEPAYGGAALVESNLAFNNGSAGIVDFDSPNVDILFNTLYLNQTNNNANSEINTFGAVGGHVENNIVYAGASNPLLLNQSTSGTVYAFNLGFGGNGTTMTGTNNVTGQNPNFVAPTIVLPPTLTTNPITWKAFATLAGSPAIDAGTGSFTRATDILGRPGLAGITPDMGAYESECSGSGGNIVRTLNFLTGTEFASGQGNSSITPGKFRDMIVSLWCGRLGY